jgi:hypothetical protein
MLLGTAMHNIEITHGRGEKLARVAGDVAVPKINLTLPSCFFFTLVAPLNLKKLDLALSGCSGLS